jgi:catechol 2,3-dioxygenase-like lactoylglutathione lyase family enzyme
MTKQIEGAQRRTFLARAASLGGLLLGGLAVGRSAHAAAPKSGGLLPPPSFLHVAINVSNMERSTAFYVEALGFEKLNDITPDAKANQIMGFPDTEIKARQLRLPGGLTLLMREFVAPRYSGVRDVPVMNKVALINFAIRVDNIDRVGKKVQELGGTVVTETRTREGTAEKPGPDVVFCFDPDGIRVELVAIG